jgi:hypothetical protein
MTRFFPKSNESWVDLGFLSGQFFIYFLLNLYQFRLWVDSAGRSEFYNYNYYTIVNLQTFRINKKKINYFL